MKSRSWIVGLLPVLLLLYGCAQLQTGLEGLENGGNLTPLGAVPGQFIIVLKDDIPSAAAVANEMAQAHGLGLLQIYEHALKGFAATVPAGRLQALSRDPRVLFVQPDGIVEAFGPLGKGIQLDHVAAEIPTGINRFDAELNANAAAGINVAVIDTGIDLTHPDLNTKAGKNCTGQGSPNDGNGHGSHVAGTIGAKDNGSGVVGVAPGVTLWAVKVLNNAGSGTISSIVCGIDFVSSTRTDTDTTNDIAVANMSLGGSGSDDGNCGNTNKDAMHKAICNSVAKGVIYVVAAGNSAADAKNFVPAAYDEVITVSAIADFNGKGGGGASPTCRSDVDDTFADFSNFGADVDLAAPGVCIRSTYKKGGYATLSGTSMASPHVAGLAALYVALNGLCSTDTCVANVRAALINNASKPQTDAGCGFTGDPDAFKEPLAYANAAIVGGTGTGNCQ